jgi:large subunit ribosomal protein L10
MPVPLSKKKELVEELTKQFDENPWCLLASASGMTVAQVSDLRKKLREKGVFFKVYKNTLIKRVIEERKDSGELVKLTGHLKGPTAIAFTKEDPIVSAKVFVDYIQTNDKLALKAAVYEKSYWSEADIKRLSKLGTKSAIYGGLVCQLKAPLFKLIYVLKSPGNKLVGTLKAAAEKNG